MTRAEKIADTIFCLILLLLTLGLIWAVVDRKAQMDMVASLRSTLAIRDFTIANNRKLIEAQGQTIDALKPRRPPAPQQGRREVF